MTISPGERPLTRRELRERERRLAGGSLPEQRSASSSAPRDGSAGPTTSPASSSPEAPAEASSWGRPDDDLAPEDPHRYTWKHYLALAAVGGVLGALVWSLASAAHEPGASAVPTEPITSLPADPVALRGEQ